MSYRNNNSGQYYDDPSEHDGSTSGYNDHDTYDDGYGNSTAASFHDDGYTQETPSSASFYSNRPTDRFPKSDPEEYHDEYDSDEEEEDNYNRTSEDADEYYQNYDEGRNVHDSSGYRNDEAEQERMIRKQKKREERDENLGKKIVAAVCCCCICLITILVLILVLLVFKEDERVSSDGGSRFGQPETPKPTPRPTYPIPPALRPSNGNFNPWIGNTDNPTISPYPTNVASSNPTQYPTVKPTPRPTISPRPTRVVPPEITIEAFADTYIFVDGFFQYEAFGGEDSFLVQNGLAEYYEFADALGLIAFDLTELPRPNQLTSYNSQVMLKLNHNPVAPQFNSRVPSIIEVRKLVSTPMRIETIHGGMLTKEPEGSILGKNKFTVGINQAVVQVDITDLLYPENFTEVGYDKNQLFLMLINNSTEQGDPKWTELQFQDQAGDRFKSVESGEGPSLTITYNAL